MTDSWNNRFGIQVDCISRIEEGAETCDYHTEKDIHNGLDVFYGVRSINGNPSGTLPDDFLEIVNVVELAEAGVFVTGIAAGSVDDVGKTTEVLLQVVAQRVEIETNEMFVSSLTLESGTTRTV